MAIFIPEAWSIWNKYLKSVDVLIKIILVDALSEFTNADKACDCLAQVIVTTRWIISRLITIQSRNLQGL